MSYILPVKIFLNKVHVIGFCMIKWNCAWPLIFKAEDRVQVFNLLRFYKNIYILHHECSCHLEKNSCSMHQRGVMNNKPREDFSTWLSYLTLLKFDPKIVKITNPWQKLSYPQDNSYSICQNLDLGRIRQALAFQKETRCKSAF